MKTFTASDYATEADMNTAKIEYYEDLAIRLKNDLLMRAELDSDEMLVVNLSSGLWNELKRITGS
mgnify:CR=1 FL=1